jgi:hypothetical protein
LQAFRLNILKPYRTVLTHSLNLDDFPNLKNLQC